jgi:hypothetical protein
VTRERPLYYLHIPKTGGVSLYRFIGERFAADAICAESLWDGLLALPADEAVSYSVYRGHFFGCLDDFLGRATVKLTLLRDPATRTISHYLFVRRSAQHPFHHVVSTQSLLEFVTSPATRHMVENFQARYLALNDVDLREVAKQLASVPAPFKIQTYLEKLPLPDTPLLYEQARAALTDFTYVGTTELFDEGMRCIAKIFGLQPHTPFPAENVTADDERPSPDEKTLRAIAEATEVDRALYDIACRSATPSRRVMTTLRRRVLRRPP